LRGELIDSFNKGDVDRLLSHLDPDVVDAFLADFDSFRAIAERHADSAEDLAAKQARLQPHVSARADSDTPQMP